MGMERRLKFVQGKTGGFNYITRVNKEGYDDSETSTIVVGLCRGCDQCSGYPEGFEGGYLDVELEKKDSIEPGETFFFAHAISTREVPAVSQAEEGEVGKSKPPPLKRW